MFGCWETNSRYSINEASSKYVENFAPNTIQKRNDFTNFELPCTLFRNCYTPQSVFKIKQFKN